MIALLAPLFAQAAASTFAPVVDRPIAFTVSETRQDATRRQHFAIDRRVTFRRADDGFVAEVETLKVVGEAAGAGALFEAMARSALGRRIILRLDRNGTVTDVDDLDAIWDAQMAAVTGVLERKGAAGAAMVEPVVAPLRSLPRAARVKRIGDMIATLIADRRYAPSPLRIVTTTARSPDGTTAPLTGTERITVGPDRRLMLERRAQGTIGGSTIAQSLVRSIDTATGLVFETTSIETIETPGGRLIATRSTRIASPVS